MNLDFLLASMDFTKFPSFGKVENIGIDKDKDVFKTYSDLINNNLSVGFQPKKEKHNDYKDLGIFDFGLLYPKEFDK